MSRVCVEVSEVSHRENIRGSLVVPTRIGISLYVNPPLLVSGSVPPVTIQIASDEMNRRKRRTSRIRGLSRYRQSQTHTDQKNHLHRGLPPGGHDIIPGP